MLRLIESDHDLISMFEHDLRANATRLSRGKTGSHFALTRPSGSGSCSRLRPNRIVEHVFAEVALLLVGAREGVAALNVAILAAGDIFGRADRDIVGAA